MGQKRPGSGSNRRLEIGRQIMAEKSAQLTVCARERDKSFARLAFREAPICRSIAVKSAGRAVPGKATSYSIAALKVKGRRRTRKHRNSGARATHLQTVIVPLAPVTICT
jgi:hypothetical protein